MEACQAYSALLLHSPDLNAAANRADNKLGEQKRSKLLQVAAGLAVTTVLAAIPGVAEAHLGSWSKQFNRTQKHAQIMCDAPGGSGGNWGCAEDQPGEKIKGCRAITNPCLTTSGRRDNEAHERDFVWRYYQVGWLPSQLQLCTLHVPVTHGPKYRITRLEPTCKPTRFKDRRTSQNTLTGQLTFSPLFDTIS